MARRGLKTLVAEQLDEKLSEATVDLRVQLREWGDPKAKQPDPDAPLICEVGGRWDKRASDWDGDGDQAIVWHVQPAQYEAARFFCSWLDAYIRGERVAEFEDVYTLLFAGGRRGGKSDFGVVAPALFSIANRDRIVWLICESEEKTDELLKTFEALVPENWYREKDAGQRKNLWNGTTVRFLSGFHPEMLKKGRVDFWVLNEGQQFAKEAYQNLRPPLADTGGLGIVTANPPKDPKGSWVLDVYDAAKAGTAYMWKLFDFDWELNPMVDARSLEVIRDDPAFGEDDYDREIGGEFKSYGNHVFHNWSARLNGLDPTPDLEDITRAWTRGRVGHEFDFVSVADFQLFPHMPAIVAKFFRDPRGDVIAWIWDECVVEKGNEDDLLDLLELKGYTKDNTVDVGDASGEWQDSERKLRGKSFDYYRDRGRWIHRPDDYSEKNPNILETVRLANKLMRTPDRRRLVRARPRCLLTSKALARWENRNGTPHKRSEWAHLGDCVRYLVWWAFAPRHQPRGFTFETVELGLTERAQALD